MNNMNSYSHYICVPLRSLFWLLLFVDTSNARLTYDDYFDDDDCFDDDDDDDDGDGDYDDYNDKYDIRLYGFLIVVAAFAVTFYVSARLYNLYCTNLIM